MRARTVALAAPLSPEDQVIQSMPDASPTKWHLAHTTWFFETFVLAQGVPGHRPFHPQFGFLFNSYYEAVGPRVERRARGLLSRPSLAEVHEYRARVDEQMLRFLEGEVAGEVAAIVTLGLHHEEQHQELLLTDIKHALSTNPLRPSYRAEPPAASSARAPALCWHDYPEGLVWIGHGGGGFAFDNEGPRHRAFLRGFALASRPVTCGEYLAFIDDGGYRRPEVWLSEGWDAVRAHGWRAPLYWEQRDGAWAQFTLAGMRPVDPAEPVCHVSHFEADAYARWASARLPTEAEWERVASDVGVGGNLLDGGRLHPAAAPEGTAGAPVQLYGDVWEWTQSPYVGYPGFSPAAGAVGEYNGKFMSNQIVLRGGSCFTPAAHVRPSYRNFFPSTARWQMTGVRLARDA